VLAGALVMLFFAWNGSQRFEDLEAKRSVIIHCVKAQCIITPTFILITGACAFTIVSSISSVMAGLIVDMLSCCSLFITLHNGLKVS